MRHSDGLRAALAGSQGRDPNFKNTVLLLHGDGTNGAQNNTFVDGSSNNFTITRNGNTTQGSFSPYGDNWSNYFDGTGDYLSLANNAAFDFGTGDFTVEAWVYLDSTVNPGRPDNLKTVTLFSTGSSGTNDCAFSIYGNTTTPGVGLELYQNSPSIGFSVAAPVSTNAWVHIAYVRTGTTIYGFVDGLRYTLGTTSSAISSTTAPKIGTANTTSYTNQFKGYISNLRVLKGTALYTANFTPSTTPLTAITNTSLLTCQSNRFIDNSTNAFAITRNGDVSVQRFSPFAPSAAYSTSAIGGSGYFDGNGDYFTVAYNSVFNLAGNTFTVEAWIYLTGNASADLDGVNVATIAAYGGASVNTGWTFSVIQSGTNQIAFQTNGSAANYTACNVTLAKNRWYHVAFVRNGSTNAIYLDGASQTLSTNTYAGVSTTNQTLKIGAERVFTSYNHDFPGYISNFRIVNGTAVYTSNFTPPTTPLTAITNTSLLCNFTNAGIYDNAMMNDLETVGNAQISTTQKKYGTGALYFDGSGDYLKLPQSPSFQWGTGDFTIEFWVYFSTLAGSLDIFEQRTAEPQTAIILYSTSSTIRLYVNGADRITSGTISAATWMHVALCRSGTSTKLFINGTQAGSTYTDSNNYSTQACFIGANFLAAANFFNGYIDDLRITKGVARYTANFTPPTAPLADF